MPFSGAFLVRVREAKGWKQGALARASKIAAPRLSLYEQDIEHPGTENLERLARALDVPVGFLLAPGITAEADLRREVIAHALNAFLAAVKPPRLDEIRLRRLDAHAKAPVTAAEWAELYELIQMFRGRPKPAKMAGRLLVTAPAEFRKRSAKSRDKARDKDQSLAS